MSPAGTAGADAAEDAEDADDDVLVELPLVQPEMSRPAVPSVVARMWSERLVSIPGA
ncbi:hypothetical protein GCM10010433_40260 [Streptomyces pulveraceus]